MKFQQNNDTIYKLRKEILDDIRNHAAQMTQMVKGSLMIECLNTIVTYETEERVTNAIVIEITFDDQTTNKFMLKDVYDNSKYCAYNGDNLYLEGLNDILDAVENLSAQ